MKCSKIYNFLAAIILLVCIFGCKKYLDKVPNNGISTPSTLADLQAILDYSPQMNLGNTSSYNQASTDEYFMLKATYDALFIDYQKVYTWTPFNYTWANDWSYSYVPVYNSNLCLEYLTKMEKNGQNNASWDNVKGSALFYRAYNFLQLTWTFAKAYDDVNSGTDLGICLRLNSDFNITSIRASVKESYERIITDLRESIGYLPNLPQHPLRPSKAAAYGLLARTYLSMRNYDSAFKYSDLCLGIKNNLYDFKANPSAPFVKFNNETIFYTDISSSYSSLFRSSRGLVDTLLYSAYESSDLRKSTFFNALPNGYFGFKGNYTGSGSIFFSGIATDEMFLIRAECFIRKGDKASALADLNTLLSNRYDASYTPLTNLDVQATLNRILLERRKELLYRGLRWIDIKRLNKDGANIILKRVIGTNIYTLQPNANYYALPLPSDIIGYPGMSQNPYP